MHLAANLSVHVCLQQAFVVWKVMSFAGRLLPLHVGLLQGKALLDNAGCPELWAVKLVWGCPPMHAKTCPLCRLAAAQLIIKFSAGCRLTFSFRPQARMVASPCSHSSKPCPQSRYHHGRCCHQTHYLFVQGDKFH